MTSTEIKTVRSLSGKKFRDELGLFVVEGEKMVSEALASGFRVENVYRVEEIGEKTMERLSSLSTPSPVLAVVRKPENQFPDSVPEKGLYLALDSIRDPGNLGTILRIADWFGIDTIYCSPDTADVYNPKVVQATMGSIAHVRILYTDLVELLSNAQRPVYGTLLDGENIYEQQLNTDMGIIVMGNEGNGISPAVRPLITHKLLIPNFHKTSETAESLNVAIATAITCSEFRRRF